MASCSTVLKWTTLTLIAFKFKSTEVSLIVTIPVVRPIKRLISTRPTSIQRVQRYLRYHRLR
ncbi:unnamed protein product [Haemonchus placei]|uniref:Secreted protein n=1 Tax=Haemonchus placei TaxID=6290 RepID=A0A0N4WEH2_HAEPC|nr:unnamed protein product [Haemonchus placei]